MLTDIQKTAIRTMLSITKASPERMAAIGSDDAFALSELEVFIPIRNAELNTEEVIAKDNKILADQAVKDLENKLALIAEERALWDSLKSSGATINQ